MDPALSTLIVSQTITFVLLLISEILPLYDGPYNGVLQILLGIAKEVVVPAPKPVIVQNDPPPIQPQIPLVTLPPEKNE